MAEAIDVFWHPRALVHDTGAGVFEAPASPILAVPEPHPENAMRLRNMHAMLARGPLAERMRWHAGRLAEIDELARFHDRRYLEGLAALDAAGGGRPTRSSPFARGSFDACRAAAGTALSAMAHVLEAPGRIAYALVRPPGHHAAPARADGYCFVNSVALAAELARARGARRVAILDWDVHHGNGTQAGFYERADVLTVSLHMDHGAWGPSHPETGKADEVGSGAGVGGNLNVPLPLGTGDGGYARAMAELVVPAIDAFAPEAIVVACGQDASQFDPNGRQALTMAGFRRLGAVARDLAERHCGGSLCLVQEGGYAPTYAAFCLHATLEGVLGLPSMLADPIAYLPDDPEPATAALIAIAEIRRATIEAASE